MLRTKLAELERQRSLSFSFAARCRMSEQLEAALSTEPDLDLQSLAAHVVSRLDAADQLFFARLRARLSTGKYTRAGLIRSLWRHAEQQDAARHYSPLDVLLAGLFDAGDLPDELPQTPEMVAYQPAPGRVILSLLEQVRDDDVVYDLGSGLGRVVICVALLTAARAKGVEFQPSFCAYAMRAAQQVSARNAEFIALDARDANFDDGTLFFLYTPFRGALLRAVLEKLRAVAARHAIRICTFGPCTADVLNEPWLRQRSGSSSAEELATFESVASASGPEHPRRRVGGPRRPTTPSGDR
jgi:SAM-dependent methyltransferase